MLRNFDNRLNADVIQCLRAMGHGDDLVICDTNFPADSVARPLGFAFIGNSMAIIVFMLSRY